MKYFALQLYLLSAAFIGSTVSIVTSAPFPTSSTIRNETAALPANETGPGYAIACSSAILAYSSVYSLWSFTNQHVDSTTLTLGGTTISAVTYYENAVTLYDRHARVTYSPANALSTGTITHIGPVTGTTTILNTYFPNYPFSIPTCSIQPSDCDALRVVCSASNRTAASMTAAASLETPPCIGLSVAAAISSVESSIHGCGACTIYGESVQIVYFPTSAYRNFCANTPTATLTHYGPSAVITAFSGKNFTGEVEADGSQIAVVDGHTFTSGTAYTSIATVYAVDRCSKTFEVPVKDAILAMPSESVLSLRYSQDHFQRVMETDKITGYTVSYADFNTPIPWSAWNGQNLCDPQGYGGWARSIIYENAFGPQLTISIPISKCVKCGIMVFYDPPLALQPAESVAKPTLPSVQAPSSAAASAAPSSAVLSPTAPPTALPNHISIPTASARPVTVPPLLDGNPFDPNSEPWIQSLDVDGGVLWATGANRQVKIGSVTCTSGGPFQTLADEFQLSYGNDGLRPSQLEPRHTYGHFVIFISLPWFWSLS